jgi:hypothetical protein
MPNCATEIFWSETGQSYTDCELLNYLLTKYKNNQMQCTINNFPCCADIVHGVTNAAGDTFTHPSLIGATALIVGVDGFFMYPTPIATQTGNAWTFNSALGTITLVEPKGTAVNISVMFIKTV